MAWDKFLLPASRIRANDPEAPVEESGPRSSRGPVG